MGLTMTLSTLNLVNYIKPPDLIIITNKLPMWVDMWDDFSQSGMSCFRKTTVTMKTKQLASVILIYMHCCPAAF